MPSNTRPARVRGQLATVEIVAATGEYDTTNNVLTAQRLAVLLSNQGQA